MFSIKKFRVILFSQTQRRSRSLSPTSTPRPHPPRRSRSTERLEEYDDDDEWIFDPMIDEILKHHEPELTGSSKIRQVPLLWVDVIYLLGCCHRNNFAVQLRFALIAFNESNCAQK